MSVSTRLRIASIIAFVYWIGHTAGAPWTPARGAAETAAIDALRSVHFSFQGFSRSYWDFYFGFGVAISVFLLVQAVLLWQLATLAKIGFDRLRPMIALLFAGFAANAIVAWMYFFVVPGVLALAIAAFLAAAWIAAGGSVARGAPERHVT
ncbi:MAG TPA: hypothetical protein VGK37_13265 [Casimicrobiaceae bacterium]|jgi:hypothetical protein